MPHIQDYLDVLRGNEYFTIADGQQAYFGLPMDEDSKPMTAFICHLGQYQFLKMPFGLCNAPAIYQRLMNSVLQGMLWEECLVYLDDICLISATVEEHLERLERLFKRLVAAGIVLKPSKTLLTLWFMAAMPYSQVICGWSIRCRLMKRDLLLMLLSTSQILLPVWLILTVERVLT